MSRYAREARRLVLGSDRIRLLPIWNLPGARMMPSRGPYRGVGPQRSLLKLPPDASNGAIGQKSQG